jgi:hypothetical protein
MEAYSPPPPTRILLALTPDLSERFTGILGRHHLTAVATSAQAMKELEKQFGLVIVSVHFDESQMFSLIGDIRLHSGYRKVPILSVLGSTGRALNDVTIEGLDHAVKAMRANGFLDLQKFPENEEGDARIARIVDYLILIDGDLHYIARAAASDDTIVPLERRRKGTGATNG